MPPYTTLKVKKKKYLKWTINKTICHKYICTAKLQLPISHWLTESPKYQRPHFEEKCSPTSHSRNKNNMAAPSIREDSRGSKVFFSDNAYPMRCKGNTVKGNNNLFFFCCSNLFFFLFFLVFVFVFSCALEIWCSQSAMAQSCWKLKHSPCFLFRDRLADLVIWHSATWPWLGLRVKYGKVRKLYEIGYLYAADVYNASQRLIWWANIRLNTFSHLKMYEDISWACEKCTLHDVRLALTHSGMCIQRADRKRVRGLQVFSQTTIRLKISTCRKF